MKKSKHVKKRIKIRTSKHVKKRIRRRAGSLTLEEQSAKTIQRAFRKSAHSKTSKLDKTQYAKTAFIKTRSARTIQRKIHKAFDFTRDNCAVCTEKLALTSKVSTLSCKHGLHKQCLADLKNSQAFKDKTKRRCPMCRTQVKELQTNDEDTLDINIKNVIARVISNPAYPQELVSPENIERYKIELFTICKKSILRHFGEGAIIQEIINIVAAISGRIRELFKLLKDSLTRINKWIYTVSGVLKARISRAKSIIIQDMLNEKVLFIERLLGQYGITLPTTINEQIQVVKIYL